MAPFLTSIAFLITFSAAQLYEMLKWVGMDGPSLTFGRYTIHHAYYGIALVCIAGWFSIYYKNRKIKAITCLIFGGGIGLLFSEVGLLLTHFRTRWDGLIYNGTIVWTALMMITFFFRDFWESIENNLKGISILDTFYHKNPNIKKIAYFFAFIP